MGETLGDYVRRRRMETGAWLLWRRATEPVLNIALTVGFGSGEAFSRAFKLHFGQTPAQWRAATLERQRQQSNPDQAERKFDQVFIRCKRDDFDSTTQEQILMNVKLIDLPASRVAYLRHIGPYGTSLGLFWREFHGKRVAHGLHGNMFGVELDDSDITPPEKCRYDVCVEVAANAEVKAPFSTTTLPGGRYARIQGRLRTRRRGVGSAPRAMVTRKRHAVRRAPDLRVVPRDRKRRRSHGRVLVHALHSGCSVGLAVVAHRVAQKLPCGSQQLLRANGSRKFINAANI